MRLGEPEEIIFFKDAAIGLEAVLVIDHTGLGPAAGGIRTKAYGCFEDSIADAARLARAMTLKCSIAGLDAGGGKLVVRLHEDSNREAIFSRLGKEIQRLKGRFHSAGDFGTTAQDLAWASAETDYLHTDTKTLVESVARGHLRCVEACLGVAKAESLKGKFVAVQGCGDIGASVVQNLHQAGASLVIADIDASRLEGFRNLVGIEEASPDSILYRDVDLLAPCALGGVLNQEVVLSLKTKNICGAANNLLDSPDMSQALLGKGVTIVPDFIASAGAVVDGIGESVMRLSDRGPLIDALGAVTKTVLREAQINACCPYAVAEELAIRRIAHG